MWHSGSRAHELSSCGAQAPERAGSVVAAHGLSSCDARAPEHTGSVVVAHGLSSCDVWAPEHAGSIVVAHGLSSCGTWALECTDSVDLACRLSCPVACGILVPQPGIKPMSPALEGGFLITGPPGESQEYFLHMRKLRLREVKRLGQGHPTSQQQGGLEFGFSFSTSSTLSRAPQLPVLFHVYSINNTRKLARNPGLPRNILVYSFCPSLIITITPFYSQQCLGLSDD